MKTMTTKSSFVRKVCAMAFASLLTQFVLAATPVAVWDGFKNLTPATGYEIVAGDGVVGSDGVATIAAGKTLKLTKDMGNQFTLVMEVSDIPGAAGSNYCTILDAYYANNAAHLTLDSQEGKLLHKWSHDNRDFGTANNATPISGRNVIAFAYNSASGEKTYINGTEVVSGGAYSSARINRFCIGGYWGDTPTCTADGMKVYRVELYSTTLSADEVAEIKCSRSAAAGEAYVCSNLDRVEAKLAYYTQNANVDFMLPPTGDCPAGTVVNVTTIKLGLQTGTAANSATASITLAGQNGAKGTAETSKTDGYVIQPYTFSPAVEIEIGKTYTFNAGGNKCTGIVGFSPIKGNNMGGKDMYCSVEGTVKSIIRKGTISGDCTIATATWANGAPLDGDLVELNVTNDATLTLDSTVNYAYLKITGDGALTISDITNLGSTPIVGDGTIVIDKNGATIASGRDNGTYDWGITGLTDAAKWTGTVWLKNVVWQNMNPATLGNANSTVRMTGVSGYSYNSNNATAGFAGTLDLVDDGSKLACTINNAFNSTYFFGKLTGTGTFKTTGSHSAQAKYAFKDASAFEGTITIEGNKSVTIGNDIPGVGDYFAGNVIGIRPTGTATVKAGKTWSATTITVNGKLSVENTGVISGAVTGVGTLSVPAFTTVNNNTIKTALQNQNNWKGTLQILGCNSISTDALSGTASALNNYGNVNSKIEFKDCAGTSGNGNYFGTTTAALNPEIVVTGTLKLTNGYSYDGSHTGSYTIFRKLSGSGEIVDGNSAGQMFYAKDVSDFTGSITMSAKKFVVGDHANSDTSIAGGAIIVREGYAARVDGTWSGSSVTVEGGIYGTGTVSSPLTYVTTATLEPERGVVTAGAAVTFGSSIKVKVSAAPEEEGTKVLANTSVSESLVSTAVTTVIGATESSEYSLFQKQDGIYLMKVTTLEWQGASDSAIDAAGNWKGGEFNDNLTYGLFTFPACAETTIVRVPDGTADVSHISVVSGGKYKFVGEGQTWKIGALIASGATVEFENIKVDIDVSDISDYVAMKALVGENANVAMPYAAITLGAGQTLNLYAGLTLKLPIVPTLNNAATIVVENAANVAWGTNYELLSWKTCKARFTYGRPALDMTGFTTPEGAGDARLLTAAKAVWLQLRSAKQMARKPLIVWPFGDSITEGMNAPNTRANYRIQLMQKLSLAGYNVKSVGFHDRNGPNNFGTIDPSGNRITDEEWEFHSGVGGELAVRYTGNHGTLHNSWENNLDVVGDPDVVLIHIGINDIVNGSDAQTTQAGYTLDEVKRLAKNILRERPNIKVVLSSMNRLRYGQTFQGAATPDATSGNGNRYYVKPFHDAIKAFYEEVKAGAYPEDYPADRVFFADMYENIRPQGYATLQPDEDGQPGLFIEGGGDNIHPDWAGHEIMAQTWFDQIVQAIPLDENGDYDCNLKHESPVEVTEDMLGAKKNVPAEYLKGFVQAKVMKLEGNERYTDGVTYASEPISDNSKVVEKIGYFVEYVVPSATMNIHRWVWVDMDAFGANKTLGEMLLQTSGDTRKVVSNLHIASNHLAIEPVAANTDGVSGMVEFYPNKPNGGGNVSGAPTHWMDTSSWNDGLASTMYGSFQVHRTAPNDVPYAGNARPAQVLFAYNGWMADDEKPNEFGIGNFSQHWNGCTMDWINMRESKTMNATCFQAKSIEVWVKVDAVTISIPAAPTGAEVEVTVDGEVVEIVDGSIEAAPGAEIEVAYFAARDYNMDDVVFTFVAGEESTIDISQVVPVAKVYVAQIGTDGKKYETLQAAIDAANNDDVVYLIANTTESILNNKKDLTLHINEGVTLTGTVYYYTIFNGGHTMTIEGEGTIKAGGTKPAGQLYIALYNSGTMYVKGCTIESANHVIYENAADKTVVTGGKFTKTPAPWLGRGCIATQTADKKYYIVEQLSYIAKIGETEYDSLQAAIDAVEDGQMIDLVCATDETIDFNKDFVVAIKNNGNNYGTITGAMGVWERWTAQYSNVANYVVVSKSMEDLVEHVTKNLAKYSGIHGRFYIYDDWKLAKDVTIPTVNDLSQSIFTIKDTFTLDLNGFALEQAAVVNSHGGYPTIVANYGKKVTIKDSSEAQTGILCGIGWAVDIYDDPKTCVTLESGTITTHGKVSTSVADMRGRVIRIMGGKFIMNGGAITLAHLIPGNQIFGIITASTAVASTPQIELNGGYVECAKPEQLWNEDGSNPNCLIGGSKGSTSEVEITGGSFSIVPPKTYFAEGLDAVVDENGHFHVQQVIHEGEEVTIAVSDDGEKLAPTVPETGSVEIIAPDETKVYVIDIANQEAPAALYTVVTKDAEGEVVSTSNIGVVKVEVATTNKTIAVAVPFTGATVENLLNTKLLNAGDELTAYVDGSYSAWTLSADKTWTPVQKARDGAEPEPGAQATTELKRGTAVWVTTAGQVVTLGTYDAETEIATAEEGVNLLANPTMEAFTPKSETVVAGDQVIETGVDHVRYTVVDQGGAKTWRCSTTIRKTVDGEVIDSEKIETKAPSIRVGRGYWMMKKSQDTK